jgi:hypothetical protein
MLTAYRIAYGLVLLLILGNVLRTIPFATSAEHISVLSITAVVSLVCVFVLLVGFTRI